ncbi:hypothetical protein CEXT_191861 [Caerostris extrusa]|uniref:Uncharacterized protein n=1 Tax=Caerostris extrusa TaxID=172846 RepID=A0AAV4QFZ6_CAEEX|nr:hypothetical protein CEXT_191861 [Caerostris extrusa]
MAGAHQTEKRITIGRKGKNRSNIRNRNIKVQMITGGYRSINSLPPNTRMPQLLHGGHRSPPAMDVPFKKIEKKAAEEAIFTLLKEIKSPRCKGKGNQFDAFRNGLFMTLNSSSPTIRARCVDNSSDMKLQVEPECLSLVAEAFRCQFSYPSDAETLSDDVRVFRH